jgi:hypothetical protein
MGTPRLRMGETRTKGWPCARTNCYPLVPVALNCCAKTSVTRVGVSQDDEKASGDDRQLASFTHPQGGGARVGDIVRWGGIGSQREPMSTTPER